MHMHDKTFWMLFVLLELTLIIGNVWYFTPTGVILGFVVLAIAFARFGDYMLHKHREKQMAGHGRTIERMKSWLNNQYELTRGIKDLHDYRFHMLEKKKIDMDDKIEKRYRELAGKILDLENRLNLVSRALIAQSRSRQPLDAFEKVWESLKELAGKEGHVETLSRGVKNKILGVGENAIKLRSEITKRERSVLKEEFEQFWKILKAKGRLDLKKDIDDPRLVRAGSVIISFLARLPNVEHRLKPRMLYLMESATHELGTLKRHS
jgi:hypothetical protein